MTFSLSLLITEDSLPTFNYRDQQTLSNIEKSCSEQHVETKTEPKPCKEPPTLKEMGLIFDKHVTCNMRFNTESLMMKLANLVQKEITADINVIVKGHKFACHLPLLQVSTGYFKSHTETADVQLDAEDATPVGFWKFYSWLVRADGKPERENIVELYLMARVLDAKDLLNQLWYCFDNNQLFNESTAFKLYLETVPYGTSSLQQLMLSRVRRFFLSAICTAEFVDLPAEKVYDMLSSNVINVNSEMEVLMAALRWLRCDWQPRKEHVVKIMSAIRFHLMPSWYLISLKSKQTHAVLKNIYENPTVLDMINAGLSYSVTKQFMDDATTSPLITLDAETLAQETLSRQRERIIDERAAHHHVYRCPNWRFIDFELFDAYLQQVVDAGSQFYKTLKPWEPDNLMSCCKAVMGEVDE